MKDDIKILIVEDEAITAMYLQFQLKKLNYNALKPVGSGENAIKMMKKLAESKIGTRPFFYPMHLQPVFSACRVGSAKLRR